MLPRQRRVFVLPAPDGRIDRWDRYEIGIFYSFSVSQLISSLTRKIFTSLRRDSVFESTQGSSLFVSQKKSKRYGKCQ